MLVVHDPGRIEGAEIDDFRVIVRVVLGIVAQGEDGFAGVAVPAPVEVILMSADCGSPGDCTQMGGEGSVSSFELTLSVKKLGEC